MRLQAEAALGGVKLSEEARAGLSHGKGKEQYHVRLGSCLLLLANLRNKGKIEHHQGQRRLIRFILAMKPGAIVVR